MSQISKNNQSPQRTVRQPALGNAGNAVSEQQIQEQFNQLVSEVRLLEAYYQEIVTRQQTASAALMDARAALEAMGSLSKTENSELLVPLGGGTLIFASAGKLERLVVSVGAGVAIEKTTDAAKTFLEGRKRDLEKAVTTLEGQRKEIGSRLEVGRATIQRIAGVSAQ